MSEINYLSEVRPNPGNDGASPQTCSICGALLVCLSCGNHRDEAMDQARARIAELELPIDMDEIQLALGNYSIYARPEDGMRNALAWFIRNRAALKPAEPPTEGSK